MSARAKTIALTIGDPNGIGPELAVKAAAHLCDNAHLRVILVGDEHVIRHYGERCAPGVVFHDFAAGPPKDAVLIHPIDALPAAYFRPVRSRPPRTAPRSPMSRRLSVSSAKVPWMRS